MIKKDSIGPGKGLAQFMPEGPEPEMSGAAQLRGALEELAGSSVLSRIARPEALAARGQIEEELGRLSRQPPTERSFAQWGDARPRWQSLTDWAGRIGIDDRLRAEAQSAALEQAASQCSPTNWAGIGRAVAAIAEKRGDLQAAEQPERFTVNPGAEFHD